MSRALVSSGLLALGIAAWLGAVAAAADEPSEALVPCVRGDLVGTWAVIRFGTALGARVDREDPYFYPYQRYIFHADARMRHLTSTTPVTPEDHRAILAGPATTTWTVDDRGRLLTREDGATRPDVDTCQVLVVKVVDPRSPIPGLPGDLLLTRYDESARPIARRLLRKLAGFGG